MYVIYDLCMCVCARTFNAYIRYNKYKNFTTNKHFTVRYVTIDNVHKQHVQMQNIHANAKFMRNQPFYFDTPSFPI